MGGVILLLLLILSFSHAGSSQRDRLTFSHANLTLLHFSTDLLLALLPVVPFYLAVSVYLMNIEGLLYWTGCMMTTLQLPRNETAPTGRVVSENVECSKI